MTINFSRLDWKFRVIFVSARRFASKFRVLLQVGAAISVGSSFPFYYFEPLKHEQIPKNKDESVEQKWVRDYIKDYLEEYKDEIEQKLNQMILDGFYPQELEINSNINLPSKQKQNYEPSWWQRWFFWSNTKGAIKEKTIDCNFLWQFKKLNLKQHNIQHWDLITSHPILYFVGKFTDKFHRITSMTFTNWIFHHANVVIINEKISNLQISIDLIVYVEDVSGKIQIREMELIPKIIDQSNQIDSNKKNSKQIKQLVQENINLKNQLIFSLRDNSELGSFRFTSQKYLYLGYPIFSVSPISESFLSYYGANLSKFLRSIIEKQEHHENYTSRTQEESIMNAIKRLDMKEKEL